MLRLENVGKIYSTEGNLSIGIRKVNLELNIGEFVAITGESGSGKSTLLNILSGMDSYEEGEMYVFNEETSYFSTEDLEDYRNRYVGFINQTYNMIESYTVLENVETALYYLGIPKDIRRKRALELIERVGLSKRKRIKASKLSGGEKQRVAIARALAKDPLIIAADEPTGNLDSVTSKEIIDLLYELSKDKLVLVVTHDYNEVKDYATRLIRVYDGEIKEDKVLKIINKEESKEYLTSSYQEPKVKESFSFSIKDLFSSPKRAIFYFIVLIFMSALTILALGFYRYTIKNETGYSISSFSNTDDSRVVINKKDKTAFTEEELQSIENSIFVDYIITNDLVLDNTINYISFENSNYFMYYNFFPNSYKNLTKNDLKCGRLPEASHEIVLSINREMFDDDFDDFDDFLKLVNINMDEYRVVGVVDSSFYTDGQSSYIYFYDDDFLNIQRKATFGRIRETLIYTSGDETFTEIGYYEFVSDSQLTGNEFFLRSYLGWLNDGDTITLNISDLYGIRYEKELKFKNIENDKRNYELFISEEVLNELYSAIDTPYQISAILKNSNSTEMYKRELNRSGYNAIIPSVDKSNDISLDGIMSGVLLTLAAIFLMLTFFLVYAILLHSIKSRREDIEILREIGAKEKYIKRMFTIEFSFIGLISYITTVILVIILRFVAKGEFLVAIKAIYFYDYITILILILLMTFFLSALFSKKMFKKTVKKSLEEK